MLVREVTGGKQATEVVLGVTGSWGSGKSTVLGLLQERLASAGNIAVVPFNPWLVGSRDDLLLALLDQMQISLGKHDQATFREILDALAKYRRAIGPVAGLVPIAGSTLSEVIRNLPGRKPRSPVDARKEVEKTLRAAKSAVVVLIDEFDRLEPSEMKAMGQALKAALDFPNISWVIALDSEKVTSALAGEDREWALGFLAKVVTVDIPLRPLLDDDRQRLFEGYLAEAGLGTSDLGGDLWEELRPILFRALATPRDVRRTVATFAAMHAMLAGEVNPSDVLAWAALGTLRPDLQRNVSESISWFVNNPVQVPVPRPETVLDRLGLEVGDDLGKLLGFIFPRLLNDERDLSRFGRVQDWWSAQTLLWLGPPPFNATRQDLEAFWADPGAFPPDDWPEERNRQLVGRTLQLMPELDPAGDVEFWNFFVEQLGLESLEVRDRFLAWSARPGQRERARAVFDALRQRGDLFLVPAVVRHQAAVHGLGLGRPRGDEPELLTADEIRTVVEEEAARWREWLRSGRWRDPPRVSNPLWGLVQLGGQPEEDRAEIARQLEEEGAILDFAHLVVPQSSLLNREGLAVLVSPDLVIRLAEQALPAATGEDRDRLEDLLAAAEGQDLLVFRTNRENRIANGA